MTWTFEIFICTYLYLLFSWRYSLLSAYVWHTRLLPIFWKVFAVSPWHLLSSIDLGLCIFVIISLQLCRSSLPDVPWTPASIFRDGFMGGSLSVYSCLFLSLFPSIFLVCLLLCLYIYIYIMCLPLVFFQRLDSTGCVSVCNNLLANFASLLMLTILVAVTLCWRTNVWKPAKGADVLCLWLVFLEFVWGESGLQAL